MNIKRNKQRINWIKLCAKGRIPSDVKYLNPRFTFDGLHWYVSVGVEVPNNTSVPSGDGIGIDLGIKDLAICSDGNVYQNINKTKRVKS